MAAYAKNPQNQNHQETQERTKGPGAYLLSRRQLLILMGVTGTSALAACTAGSSTSATATPGGTVIEPTAAATAVATAAASSADPLLFPVDSFTETTTTVTTSAGEKEVVYRLYQHLPYVANPVDVEYQSLNVKVPIRIDGQEVDATNAPILFVIGVGGYMSVNIVSGGMGGMGGGERPEGMTGMPSEGMTGTAPSGVMTGTAPAGMGGNDEGGLSGRADLALAAGYVVVEPGCRGRDNQADDGTYFGKAPAAIVDLKSAVRYVRHNDAIMPGNADWIVSVGTSAGGALSALLGASGNSALYDAYFAELGAADAADHIYGSADYCPITDLEHADMAYEWYLGALPLDGALVDQELSQQLRAAFTDYQASLNFQGQNSFGQVTADNLGDYMVQTYLVPSANTYLSALSDDERATYLTENSWISWSGDRAAFTWADFLGHVATRQKSLPAFDAFDLSAGENSLFGNETTNARHFTNFSLRQSSGDSSAEIEEEVQTLVPLMNPMHFIAENSAESADYWWIRHGSLDRDTSLSVIINLALNLENAGKEVDTALYWDAGHGADEDPEAFMAWIGRITGYSG